jgi:hypothetical protein
MLNGCSSLSWLCVGDFNEVLQANEQFGGARRSERQIEVLCEAASICGFSDLVLLVYHTHGTIAKMMITISRYGWIGDW